MITLREVKQSPSEPKEVPVKDFELAVSELIDGYRNTMNKGVASSALRLQADLLDRDDTWTKSSADDPDPQVSSVDPTATRADEATAGAEPEPEKADEDSPPAKKKSKK